MQTIRFVTQALSWAFHTFRQHLSLFIKLFLISGVITIATAMCTFGFALLVVPFYLTMCHIKIALKLYDNQPINSIKKDFFIDWHTFLQGLTALCLYGLLVCAGLILIIPGAYLASRYYYIIYAIVADNKDIMESFTYSERLTAPLPWHGFLLLLYATLLGGSLIFLGVAALMNVYAYKQCQKMRSSL